MQNSEKTKLQMLQDHYDELQMQLMSLSIDKFQGGLQHQYERSVIAISERMEVILDQIDEERKSVKRKGGSQPS